MDEEIKSIWNNDTKELKSLPKRKKTIRVRWVYKTKENVKEKVERYKARLVANDHKQQ